MSVSHQRTLPGINAPTKGYLTFTDSLISGIVAVAFGGALATDPAITALQHGMLTSTPTAARIWTLPTAVVLLANLTQYTNIDVGDGFEFIIRNLATIAGRTITLTVAAGITADSEANLIIQPGQFSKFILRCDDPNPLAGQADFEIYQVDSGASSIPGPAYLSASATTIGAASALTTTPAAFANLTFTVGAGVAPPVGAAVAGLVATSSTFTVTNAGVYKIDASVSGNSSAAQNVILQVAVGAVVNVQVLGADDAAAAADGVNPTGSIILPLAAGAVLSLFGSLDAATSNLTVIAASINIVRLA